MAARAMPVAPWTGSSGPEVCTSLSAGSGRCSAGCTVTWMCMRYRTKSWAIAAIIDPKNS